jgi:hypothetical protein
MRVVGVDVGAKNMAVCLLEIDPVRTNSLAVIRDQLTDQCVKCWQVFEVIPMRATTTKQMEIMIAWVNANEHIFSVATHVVIEQQMTARMKNLSTCIYICVRNMNKDAVIIIQPASKKLLWSDLGSFVIDGDITSYYQRKKTAVCIARELFCDCVEASEIMSSSKKKDDLADALLHALFFAFTGMSKSPARQART